MIVHFSVILADVTPIACQVASKKGLRKASVFVHGSERARGRDDLTRREFGLRKARGSLAGRRVFFGRAHIESPISKAAVTGRGYGEGGQEGVEKRSVERAARLTRRVQQGDALIPEIEKISWTVNSKRDASPCTSTWAGRADAARQALPGNSCDIGFARGEFLRARLTLLLSCVGNHRRRDGVSHAQRQ